MPRYYFHSRDGGEVRDEEGMELAGLEQARREAVRYAGAVLHDQPGVLWDGRDFRVEVRDDQDRLILTVITIAVGADGEG